MAARKQPTPDEVNAALETSRLRSGMGPNKALPWHQAVRDLEFGLRTTRTRAGDWLVDAVSTPDNPIIAVWLCGMYMGPKGNNGDNSYSLTELGWDDDLRFHLHFTAAGERIPYGDPSKGHRTEHPWIMRRTDLESMRQAIVQERADHEQKLSAERMAEIALFDHDHPEAWEILHALFRKMPPHQFTDRLERRVTRDEQLVDSWTERFGDAATVTIQLTGREIDAFAALIRPLVTEQE